MSKLMLTPSQTVGPYFAYGLTSQQYGYDHKQVFDGRMVDETVEGERITIVGRVIDGQGEAIPDAMVELWQSDIQAFGRQGTGTNPQNQFIFTTIKPLSVEGQAPHLTVIVFMRGLLSHAYTRLYFSDESKANTHDAVLKSIPKDRRETLMAQKKQVNGQTVYVFDIRMQGEAETVFFDM